MNLLNNLKIPLEVIPVRRNGCVRFIPIALSQQPGTIEDICTRNCIIDSIAFGNKNITYAECHSCCKHCINNQDNPSNCARGCAIGGQGGIGSTLYEIYLSSIKAVKDIPILGPILVSIINSIVAAGDAPGFILYLIEQIVSIPAAKLKLFEFLTLLLHLSELDARELLELPPKLLQLYTKLKFELLDIILELVSLLV